MKHKAYKTRKSHILELSLNYSIIKTAKLTTMAIRNNPFKPIIKAIPAPLRNVYFWSLAIFFARNAAPPMMSVVSKREIRVFLCLGFIDWY